MTPEEKKELERQLLKGGKYMQDKKSNPNNIVRLPKKDINNSAQKQNDELKKKQEVPVYRKRMVSNKYKQKNKKSTSVLHTFKDDVQNVVRQQKVSMVKIAALEAKKKKIVEVEETEVEKSYTIAIISFVFILLGVLAIGGVYSVKFFNNLDVEVTQKVESIFFVENRQQYDSTNRTARDIKIDLLRIRNYSRSSLGSIEQIFITKEMIDVPTGEAFNKELTSVEFLNAIDAHVSESFKNSLNDKFLLGLNVMDSYVPVLVLKIDSYGGAFTGMLNWEKKIEDDLYPFFNMAFDTEKNATAVGNNSFNDVVLENHDVRILRDSKDRIRMVYSFLDRETLVITGSPNTLLEVRDRLRAR